MLDKILAETFPNTLQSPDLQSPRVSNIALKAYFSVPYLVIMYLRLDRKLTGVVMEGEEGLFETTMILKKPLGKVDLPVKFEARASY